MGAQLGIFLIFVLCLKSIDAHIQERPRTGRVLTSDVYHGCGFEKYCLKICHSLQPSCGKCINEHNCPAMVTVEFRDDKYYTKMIIQEIGQGIEFVAIGLSDDTVMGDEIIVICLVRSQASQGNIQKHTNMFGAWTTGQKIVDYNVVKEQPYYDLTHELIDGTYVCSFQWKKKFTANGKPYNLEVDQYYVLAARGEASSLWIINGHQKSEVARVVSATKSDLQAVPELEDYDERYDGGTCQNISIFLLVSSLIFSMAYFVEQDL